MFSFSLWKVEPRSTWGIKLQIAIISLAKYRKANYALSPFDEIQYWCPSDGPRSRDFASSNGPVKYRTVVQRLRWTEIVHHRLFGLVFETPELIHLQRKFQKNLHYVVEWNR